MFLQSTFITEFLAQTNLTLTQEDFGSKLGDLLLPIKNYLQKEKNILSFSLARYCGGTQNLAFFCEWYYQSNKLTRNSHPLFVENHEYLVHKIPERLSGINNIEAMVDQQIINCYLPAQMSIFQFKSRELMTDLITKDGYLNRYLNNNFLGKVAAAELETAKGLLLERTPVSQFAETQGYRLSFVQIAVPCLLGFLYNFNQKDSPINVQGVKWFMVEEILYRIAFLHQTASTTDLTLFLYRLELTESQEFNWLSQPRALQIEQAGLDEGTRVQIRSVRDKALMEAGEKLDKLIFPEKYKEMLRDLLDWSYTFGQEKE